MTSSKFLNPKNDVAFRRTFGSERYKHVLIMFLNDILQFEGGAKVVDVTFLSPIQDLEIASQRSSIVDVLCKDSNGVQYIIEMQVAQEKGFEKRALYYASRAYASQLDKGDKRYYNLKELIFIAITNYVVFPEKEGYKSDHIILDKKTHEHNMKDMFFTFIELPKYKKGKSEKLSNRIEQWCRYFKYGDDTTEEEVEKIVDPEIKEAYEAINAFNWSKDERAFYDKRIKDEMDYICEMEAAEDRGIKRDLEMVMEQGMENGVEMGKAEVAKNMLGMGLSIDVISSATGLSQEAIAGLK